MEYLYQIYKEFFPIGVAVGLEHLEKYWDLLKHFNSITPENELKFCEVHPEESTYHFEKSDKLVQYAKENNKLVRGHTLVWHTQNPDWLFEGKMVSRDMLLKRMEDHISVTVDRYKDSIYCWDVVNEIFPDGEGKLRDTRWKEIIGEDYVEKAFCYAHETNPKAKLFLNEYNCEEDIKLDLIIDYICQLKKKKIPIDGVGVQGHYSIVYPDLEKVRKMFYRLAKLDLQIQITELDISMFAFEDHSCDKKAPSREMIDAQARYYSKLFSIFREYKDVITGVTLWGAADDFTWLDDFPVIGRKNWPLLFDEKLQPKKAFYAIADFRESQIRKMEELYKEE